MTSHDATADPGVPRLLGPVEVRELAERLGVRPTKQRGQNFVIDANTVRRIVRASGVGPDDVVVEVGPGLGSLTLALLAVARRVVAVEIDPVLARALPATIAEHAPAYVDACEVVEADALRVQEPAGPAAHRPGGQPALQRLGSGAAAPARPAAEPRARDGDGAGRGRRPAGRPARLTHLRRALGQGRVVRRAAPRRVGGPLGVLARPERRERAGGLGALRPAGDVRLPRRRLRRRRRRLRPAPQDRARRPEGGRDHRAGGGRARRRRRRPPAAAARSSTSPPSPPSTEGLLAAGWTR